MTKSINPRQSLITVENIYKAKVRLKQVAVETPLVPNLNFSDQYDCNLFLKREDLQVVRSYKIRGAYNKMVSTPPEILANGVVAASAGNHAQGVALACQLLGVNGKIFMPSTTPKQKIDKVKLFGKERVQIELIGDTYDACYNAALEEVRTANKLLVPPFDDIKIVEGQGTVGSEILEACDVPIDYLFLAVGGGGLAAGVGSYFRQISPNTKIIGVEPEGAPAMKKSLEAGKVVTLDTIDTFVDGAAVQRVGDLNFEICKNVLDDIILVPEGKVCTSILQLYNEEGIVAEPAGALTIAALDFYRDEIKGKNVVVIISGGNNDITRTEEIKERSLLYEGLKHYFVIRFPQRAGALREFVNHVLGENDDITFFEYNKKTNRGLGPAVVGIEVQNKKDYKALLKRMKDHNFDYQALNESPMLFEFLI
ncbi:MAG: threonine ammonia-lyase [Bacteroidota bacterium]